MSIDDDGSGICVVCAICPLVGGGGCGNGGSWRQSKLVMLARVLARVARQLKEGVGERIAGCVSGGEEHAAQLADNGGVRQRRDALFDIAGNEACEGQAVGAQSTVASDIVF
jgi:hypothetical protein